MDQTPRFANRVEAGRRLAAELRQYAHRNPVVLGLPRGGVPVAHEIARELGAELDVWIVRKVGVPWHAELGIGAVSEGGYVHISRNVLAQVGLSEPELARAIERATVELEERVRRFRRGRARPALNGKVVIVVDDGIATGGSMRAAIGAIRAHEPEAIVLAVPVAAADTIEELESEVDATVCLTAPTNLYAIGLWYDDFHQLSDAEVLQLLSRPGPEEPEPPHAVA